MTFRKNEDKHYDSLFTHTEEIYLRTPKKLDDSIFLSSLLSKDQTEIDERTILDYVLPMEAETRTREEMDKLREAIGEAGLTGVIGSPQVYSPEEAVLAASNSPTVSGSQDGFYLRLTSTQDILAIAEALKARETEE